MHVVGQLKRVIQLHVTKELLKVCECIFEGMRDRVLNSQLKKEDPRNRRVFCLVGYYPIVGDGYFYLFYIFGTKFLIACRVLLDGKK